MRPAEEIDAHDWDALPCFNPEENLPMIRARQQMRRIYGLTRDDPRTIETLCSDVSTLLEIIDRREV